MIKSKVFDRCDSQIFDAKGSNPVWPAEHLPPFIIPKKAKHIQVVYTVKETKASCSFTDIVFGNCYDFEDGTRVTKEKFCHILWW